MTNSRKALISGASIAGPATALWLAATGWEVTVVERARSLRPGGQAVDLKGEVHARVLGRMGITDEVEAAQTGKTDVEIVDAADRRLATIPGEFIGGDVEILRGDLAEILYRRTSDRCRYVFDDTITALREGQDGVDVEFEHTPAERFDVVIGADGIHSATRRLAFGPEQNYVRHNGYYYAVAGSTVAQREAEGHLGRPERQHGTMYTEPGRTLMAGGPKAPAMFVFASDPIDYDRRDVDQQKRVLRDHCGSMGWRTPQILAEALRADDFYLDAIARVAMDSYTTGRVALVGDAGYGNTLGGFGTGLALVGGYVLAGELAAAGDDHRTAFARYDTVMHRYAKVARSGNAGPFLAPSSPLKARLRNATFNSRMLFGVMMWMTDRFATRIDLPDYPLSVIDRRC